MQQQRLPARQRPQIRRANIVCAEPIPGDKAMLREFIASQFAAEEQPAFTFLLERVFDRMGLAGEAGSLLKIEEEISEAIAEARLLALNQSAPRQTLLFAVNERTDQPNFDLRKLSKEQFWQKAEQRIYEALEVYAEQAENEGFQRRLFANDAAQGFAFIDLSRKNYDGVVMNPPFGVFPASADSYLNNKFPNCRGDFYPTFIERWTRQTNLLGAITSA